MRMWTTKNGKRSKDRRRLGYNVCGVRPLRPPWRIIPPPVRHGDNSGEPNSSIEDKKLKGT